MQTKEPDRETNQAPKKTPNKEGLDRAYASANSLYRNAQGALHVAGTRGGLLGSDWMENYKIYGLGLAIRLGEMYGKKDSGKFDTTPETPLMRSRASMGTGL